MDSRRTLDEIFDKYKPVKERSWYPWVWPTVEWFVDTERSDPKEFKKFMGRVKELADSDFFFFCNEIMRSPESMQLDPDLHGELCYLLQQRDDIVVLIPRGHLKTTIANVYYTIWRLAHAPTVRFKVASENSDVAEEFLRDEKRHIESNRRLHMIYPNLLPAPGMGNRFQLWSKNQISVRRNTTDKRGASVMVMSAGQSQTGTHCDEFIYDDIMTPRNADTLDKRNKIKMWFHESQPLIDPGDSRKIVIGTRYHFDDIYGMLKDQGEMPMYERKAIENNQFVWKEPKVIAKIEEAKRILPIYVYSCQYLNTPISEGQAEFKPEWVHHWSVDDVLKGEYTDNPVTDIEDWYKTLDIYMGMDANRTVKKRSDKSALLVLGVDIRNRKFVLDRVSRTMHTANIRDTFCMMFHNWEKYNILKAGIETIGGDNHIYEIIREKLMQMDLPFHKVKSFFTERGTPKEDRIRAMQPEFYHGNIFIRNDMDDFDAELLQFPFGAHDDDLDVLSYMLTQLVKPKRIVEKREEVKGWRKKHNFRQTSGNWLTAG